MDRKASFLIYVRYLPLYLLYLGISEHSLLGIRAPPQDSAVPVLPEVQGLYYTYSGLQIYARKMHACEVHTHETHTPVECTLMRHTPMRCFAREVHAHEIYACEVHAH